MIAVAALAIYAAIDKSVVMFVSAITVGLIVYLFRNARVRDRIIAIAAAGLGGGIATEIVLTFYYHTNAAEPVADTGSLFLSAIYAGLINAAVVVIAITIGQALKIGDRESE